MAEITASLVKELRERTGAGMMECKKALTENNGDIDVSADASIGLAYSGLDPADDPADLLRQADLAMYEAKAAGRNTIRFYAPELRLPLVARDRDSI